MKLLFNFKFLKFISSFYIIALNEFILSTITVYDDSNLTLANYDDLPAGFGPSISDDGFQGYIAVANPIEACTSINKPPENVSYVDPKSWIALIQRTPGPRSNCTFDLKVYNAQRAGFSAVIIFNLESDNLIKMSSSNSYSIKIPSFFVGQSSANELRSYFTYKNKTYVKINTDDADFNYLIIPFVCVISVCFIIAIFVFLVKFALHCHKIRKNRFPRSALRKIPTKKYQKTDKYDTCPICLNEYEEGVKIRILPCEHAYHIECIDKWLLRNNRACPVCKRRVIPGGSDSESEDSTNNTSTTNAHLLERPTSNLTEETEANEDDDTNESSRLLVSNRNYSNNNLADNSSNLLNNNLNNTNRIELGSLNNHMTTSLTSNQLSNATINNNSNKELRSSSSKYGSITSINLLANNNSNLILNENLNLNDQQISDANKDSKATPDYYTPYSDPEAALKVIIVEPTSSISASKSNQSKKQQKRNKKARKVENENASEDDSDENADQYNKMDELSSSSTKLVSTKNNSGKQSKKSLGKISSKQSNNTKKQAQSNAGQKSTISSVYLNNNKNQNEIISENNETRMASESSEQNQLVDIVDEISKQKKELQSIVKRNDKEESSSDDQNDGADE